MQAIENLVTELRKFPGLGKKSARRIAYYLINQDEEYLSELGNLISDLRKNLFTCKLCGNISDSNPCSICSDEFRDRKTICLVEDIESISAFEFSGVYHGLYHVLGKITPVYGETFSEETLKFLQAHINFVKADEVIIATTPKIDGDLAYYALVDFLKQTGVEKISRIAFGLPVGGSIEFADKVTIHTALESRRQIN